MSRLRLNLVDRDAAALLWTGSPKAWLAAALGVLVLCLVLLQGSRMKQQLDVAKAAEQELAARLEHRSARDARESALNLSPAQVLAINAAIRQLNLPWSELMQALEAAASPKVAVLEWSPQAQTNTLKGLAEARSSEDMIAYVQTLKEQEFFSAVVLTSHQINEQDRNKPLRFDFVVTWRSR